MRKCPKCKSSLVVGATTTEQYLSARCPSCRWEGVVSKTETKEERERLDEIPDTAAPVVGTRPFRVKITGVENRESAHGGRFFHIFFKGNNGKSYLTHAFPKWNGSPVRNFPRWQKVIDLYRAGHDEVILEGVHIKKDNIIDADSMFQVVKRGES